ncbi:hypothetical protein T484DRAFT_1987308 [Baffinella frigidus]|nr:hypothetical protein T484DRAFT_1987308 [Cryptophyta sp. CCMP2293]
MRRADSAGSRQCLHQSWCDLRLRDRSCQRQGGAGGPRGVDLGALWRCLGRKHRVAGDDRPVGQEAVRARAPFQGHDPRQVQHRPGCRAAGQAQRDLRDASHEQGSVNLLHRGGQPLRGVHHQGPRRVPDGRTRHEDPHRRQRGCHRIV